VQNRAKLGWHGFPDYYQILAVCEIICKVAEVRRLGAFSDKQLAFYINKLREAKKLTDFFDSYAESYNGKEEDLDKIFNFLRACEHSLPELFGCVELFARKVGFEADYSLITGALPRWFKPECLKILEERGVPVQISERFYLEHDTTKTLSIRLLQLADKKDDRLSFIEQEWIKEALS
jgi:hypothetical protein